MLTAQEVIAVASTPVAARALLARTWDRPFSAGTDVVTLGGPAQASLLGVDDRDAPAGPAQQAVAISDLHAPARRMDQAVGLELLDGQGQ